VDEHCSGQYSSFLLFPAMTDGYVYVRNANLYCMICCSNQICCSRKPSLWYCEDTQYNQSILVDGSCLLLLLQSADGKDI